MQDLLVCITAHREGELLHDALKFAENISKHPDFSSDVLVTLDRADEETLGVARRSPFRTELLDFGDVGLVRNHVLGTHFISHKFVLFLDGDDWCSIDWVISVLGGDKFGTVRSIYTPKYRVLCWQNSKYGLVFRQPNSLPGAQFPGKLLEITNLWSSCVMIPKHLRRELRYRVQNDGFVNEDWWMNYDAWRRKSVTLLPMGTFTTVSARLIVCSSNNFRRERKLLYKFRELESLG